jgi:carbon-monoxide dehydrogenase medium subunit
LNLGFDVFLPRNETELLSFIAKRKNVLLLSGGTDILRAGERTQGHCLVDISHLENLRYISREEDIVKVGALTRISDFMSRNVDLYEGFKQVAEGFGGPAIANMATVGGNICAASPAADLLPVLIALDATVVTRSLRGQRTTGIQRFLLKPQAIGLRGDELIVEVQFEAPAKGMLCTFRKIGRRSSVFTATVSLSIFVHFDDTMKIKRARVALNALRGPMPGRAKLVEEALLGRKLDHEAVQEAVSKLSDEFSTPSDINASAEYKLEAAKGLLEDQLYHIKDVARGG